VRLFWLRSGRKGHCRAAESSLNRSATGIGFPAEGVRYATQAPTLAPALTGDQAQRTEF
jgi:hypothetical protein